LILFTHFIFDLKISFKDIAIDLSLILAGCLILFIPIVGILFGFDFILCYKHFIGFFAGGTGWGISHPNDLRLPHFLKTLEMNILIFSQGLLSGVTFIKALSKKDIFNFSIAFSLFFLFCTSISAYYLNYVGGGFHYLMPVFLFSYYYIAFNMTNINDFISDLKLIVISNKIKKLINTFKYKHILILTTFLFMLINIKFKFIFGLPEWCN